MRKILWILPILLLVTIIAVLGDSITIAIDSAYVTTGTSNPKKDVVKINASVTTAEINATNATFYYSSDSGTTWYSIGTNRSSGNTTLNPNFGITWNTKLIYDVNSPYYLRVVASGHNTTEGHTITNFTSTSLTNVYIDNSVPVCSVLFPASSTTYETGVTFVATATNSSSCKVEVGNVYTGTINGSNNAENCYKTFGKTYPPESYYNTITFSLYDEINSTTCTASSVTFDDQGRNIGVTVDEQGNIVTDQPPQPPQNNNTKSIGIILLIAAAFIIFSKKKR